MPTSDGRTSCDPVRCSISTAASTEAATVTSASRARPGAGSSKINQKSVVLALVINFSPFF